MGQRSQERGLPNLKTTPEALAVTKDAKVIAMFERHGVLTKTELVSRYDVYMETYNTILKYESDLAAQMAKNMIMPAVLSYQGGLAETIKAVETSNKGKVTETRKILKEVTDLTETAWEQIVKLEKASPGGVAEKIKSAMEELRETIDTLEGYVPAETWPLPSYAEMLFLS